jgi:hypothetical protein
MASDKIEIVPEDIPEEDTEDTPLAEDAPLTDEESDFIKVESRKKRGKAARVLAMENPNVDTSHRLYKTEICSFYARGQCDKGSECAYAHGEEELRAPPVGTFVPSKPTFQLLPDLDSKESFPVFMSGGMETTKTYRQAAGGHANKQLPRQASVQTNFKSILCAHMRNDRECPFGDRCKYAHTQDELQAVQCRDYPYCGKEDCAFRHNMIPSPNGVRDYMASDAPKVVECPKAPVKPVKVLQRPSVVVPMTSLDEVKEVKTECTNPRRIVIEMSTFDPAKTADVCALIAGLSNVKDLYIVIR